MRRGLLLGLMILLALLAASCGGPEQAEPEETSSGPATVTINDLMADPGAYEGQTIAVVGQVTNVYGSGAVELASCTILDCSDLLAIGVSSESAQAAVQSNSPLEIRGTVERLTQDSTYSGIDPADPAYSAFIDQPVLVVDSTETLTVDIYANLRQALVEQITSSPDLYIGREVALEGVIGQVFDDRTFTLTTTFPTIPKGILIYAMTSGLTDTAPVSGSAVQVRGQVRWFDQQQVPSGLSGDAAKLASYDGRTMIAADAIWIAPGGSLGAIRNQQVLPPASVDDDLQLLGILEQPARLVGSWVQIAGDLSERIDENGFLLSGLGIQTQSRLLVLDVFESSVVPAWEPGNPLLITGQVGLFSQTASERLLDTPLNTAHYAPYEGHVMILPETIRLIPPTGVQTLRSGVLEAIASDASQFIGWTATVFGRVDDRIGSVAATLSTGLLGSELLILSDGDTPLALQGGQEVTATGKVRWFDAASLGDEYGIDLSDKAFERHAGDPVLVVGSVVVESGP